MSDYDQIGDEEDSKEPYLSAPIRIENETIIILCCSPLGNCLEPATLFATEGSNATYCQKCHEADQNLLKTEIPTIPLIIQNPDFTREET